jgi:hypothetical protein
MSDITLISGEICDKYMYVSVHGHCSSITITANVADGYLHDNVLVQPKGREICDILIIPGFEGTKIMENIFLSMKA